ncbi:MAG: cytochrome c [Gemmatimonadetes bacterium]|nr:cytochrome c [Gemmatimonadota bacterium]
MAERRWLAAGLVLLAACNPDTVVHKVGWFATMRHQRNIKPYAMPLNPVPGTVPVTGAEPDSLPLALADKLVNSRTRTAESLNRGQWVYQTYCEVCHGAGGKGDGPISATNGQTPPGPFVGVRSLVDSVARRRSDGYIYGMVINGAALGRGLMPRYWDRVRGTDRWDVVNYVRNLQQQAQGGGR